MQAHTPEPRIVERMDTGAPDHDMQDRGGIDRRLYLSTGSVIMAVRCLQAHTSATSAGPFEFPDAVAIHAQAGRSGGLALISCRVDPRLFDRIVVVASARKRGCDQSVKLFIVTLLKARHEASGVPSSRRSKRLPFICPIV